MLQSHTARQSTKKMRTHAEKLYQDNVDIFSVELSLLLVPPYITMQIFKLEFTLFRPI